MRPNEFWFPYVFLCLPPIFADVSIVARTEKELFSRSVTDHFTAVIRSLNHTQIPKSFSHVLQAQIIKKLFRQLEHFLGCVTLIQFETVKPFLPYYITE